MRVHKGEKENGVTGSISGSIQSLFDLWKDHQAGRGLSEYTLKTYEQHTRYFVQFISGCDLDWRKTKPSDIHAWMSAMKTAGLESKTIKDRVTSAGQFWKWMVQTERVATNPFGFIDRIKAEKKLPGLLSEEEVMEMIKACETPKELAIMQLMYGSGCRAGEIVGMKIKDVDFSQKRVFVVGKGKKQRYVPLPNSSLDALNLYIASRTEWLSTAKKPDHPALFLGRNGDPLDYQGLYRIIKTLANRAEIKGSVHPHMIRHSFATHHHERGTDIRDIQELLGHDWITTTQGYTHVSGKHLQDVQKAHPLATGTPPAPIALPPPMPAPSGNAALDLIAKFLTLHPHEQGKLLEIIEGILKSPRREA